MPRNRRDDDDDDDEIPRRRSRSSRDDDNDDDEAPRRSRRSRSRNHDDGDEAETRPTGSNGLATTSLVLGVLSFCTGITFIPGLICGFMGLAKAKKVGTGKGMAIAGIATSFGGLFVSIGLGVGIYFLAQFGTRDRERNLQGQNFRQGGLALHNLHDANSTLPKPYIDENEPAFGAKPPAESELKNKLSWRVALLPYVEQANLYTRFNRKENWDSSTNKPLSQTVVTTFADTDTPQDPTTRMRCFYGNGAAFELNARFTFMNFSDGTSNTILYVEGAEKVTWSQFNEYKFEPNGPLPALGHPNRDTFLAVFADGAIRHMRKTQNPTTLKALITRAGGEVAFAD